MALGGANMKKIFYIIIPLFVFFGFNMMPKAIDVEKEDMRPYNTFVTIGGTKSGYGANSTKIGMYSANTQYTASFDLRFTNYSHEVDFNQQIAAVIDFCVTGTWVESSPYYSNATNGTATMYWTDLNRRCFQDSQSDAGMYRMVIIGKFRNIQETSSAWYGALTPTFKLTTGQWGASARPLTIKFYYTSSTDFKNLESDMQNIESQNKTNGNLNDIKNQNTEAENTRKGIWGTLKSVLTGITNLPNLIWNAIKGGFEAITNGIKGLFDFFKDGSVDNSSSNGFFDNFNTEDNGGISGVVTAPLRFVRKITGTCESLELSVMDQEVILPCGDTLFWNREDVLPLRTIWNILFGGLIIYRLLLKLFKVIHNMKDPDNSKVEVMDL